MELSDDEILEKADRIRVRRGLRIVRECAQCGNSFLADEPVLYCSDVCRETGTQQPGEPRATEHDVSATVALRGRGETIRDFIIQERAKLVEQGEMSEDEARLTEDDEAFVADFAQLEELRQRVTGTRAFDMDSTDVLREEREQRSRYQTALHGLDT